MNLRYLEIRDSIKSRKQSVEIIHPELHYPSIHIVPGFRKKVSTVHLGSINKVKACIGCRGYIIQEIQFESETICLVYLYGNSGYITIQKEGLKYL